MKIKFVAFGPKHLLQTIGVTGILRTLLVGFFLLSHSLVFAGAIPPPIREDLLEQALKAFWGNAKMPDGNLIQPESEEERRMLPINEHVANFTFDVREYSGLAQWCGVSWESNFEALMRNARKNGQSEKQVAFISVVHGIAQETVASAMIKTGQCSLQVRDSIRRQIARFLAKEPK